MLLQHVIDTVKVIARGTTSVSAITGTTIILGGSVQSMMSIAGIVIDKSAVGGGC